MKDSQDISLPAENSDIFNPPDALNPPEPRSKNPRTERRHVVFVIDDEPGITRLCQRLLVRAGFQVSAFTDPQAGISALEKVVATLLLVDIRMPGIDGFQVIDAARRQHADLAVVVMTGFGTVETAIEALRRGADGLILKPFSGVELVQSVQRAIEQSQHKQDVLRLQALRPLFDVSESLFTETNPKRLRTLILEAVCGHLKCGHAEFYQPEISLSRGSSVAASISEATGAPRPAGPLSQSTSGGNPDTKTRLRLISAIHPGQERRVYPAGTGFLTEPIARRSDALRTPLLIHLEKTPDEPDALNPPETDTQIQQILLNRGLETVMCAPVVLKAGATVNGVLLAARDIGEPRFREADLEMFVVLARQAAVALENARLHAELRDYIHQLEDSQRALIQAEKMATAGRLTASIAHEINNPLQAVQNCLHLAGRKELSEEQRQKYLDMARTELERLMNTVQRMLDFYRPAALDRKPIDINKLLESVLSLVSPQLKDHNILIYLDLSPGLPHVLVVADQIQQVFLNLLLNALEAMPRGGDLFIQTSIGGTPSSQHEIEVIIEDSGPGVPPSERKHIFEPFVSTKEKGTGLGLAVSYGIVTAHGGSLELVDGRSLTSRHPGLASTDKHRTEGARSGACFRVSLPIVEHT